MRCYIQKFNMGSWVTPLGRDLEPITFDLTVDVADRIEIHPKRVRAVSCLTGRIMATSYVRVWNGQTVANDVRGARP